MSAALGAVPRAVPGAGVFFLLFLLVEHFDFRTYSKTTRLIQRQNRNHRFPEFRGWKGRLEIIESNLLLKQFPTEGCMVQCAYRP